MSAKKNRILEAGITLAKQKGYINVTCREVANLAKVARTLIYYYFKDCSGMRSAIIKAAAERQELSIVAQAMAMRDPSLKVSDNVKRQARKHL